MNDVTQRSMKCPICNKGNNCGSHSCWCMKEYFPKEIFELVPDHQLRKSCICKECLDKFKEKQE